MPVLRNRTQQQAPVQATVAIPVDFPSFPQEVRDRFASIEDMETRLQDFWDRTNQALQEAQVQTARQVNANTVYSINSFRVYGPGQDPQAIFALDGTGIRIGHVLVVNTAGRTLHVGVGQYANNNTPIYMDILGRFSLGDALAWDSSADTLTISGAVVIGGTVGGFSVGSDYIRDAADSFGLASTVTGGDDVRLWAGDTFANRATAPFRVYESGIIAATRITTTGIGIGGAAVADTLVAVLGSKTASAGNVVGLRQSATLTAGANADNLFSMHSAATFAKGAFTGLAAFGFYTTAATASGAGTITNAYGIYVDTVNIGSTNYGVYVATTAANYFAGISTFNLGLVSNADITLAGAGGKQLKGIFTGGSSILDIGLTDSGGGAPAVRINRGSTTGTQFLVYRAGTTTLDFAIDGSGDVTIPRLAGVGSRTVVADANGKLSAP